MIVQKNYRALSCADCAGGAGLDFELTMAFQPIVNFAKGEIYAREALVRGVKNESAGEIFKHVNEGNRYRFDQACRVKAVQLASQLGMPSYLSINFMPNAVYRPDLRGRRFRRWQSCHRNCSNVEVDVQIVREKTSDRGPPCLAGLRSAP